MPTFLKKLLKVILYIMVSLLVLAVSLISTIDRTPFRESEAYKETFEAIRQTDFNAQQSDSVLYAGWAKESIMPSEPQPLAGYGWRGYYEEVYDSLFVRSMVFQQGDAEAVVVSIDLMVFPPDVIRRVNKQLGEIGLSSEQIYYSAIHTHNGFGGWDNSLIGQAMTGLFEEELSQFLADKVFLSISNAKQRKKLVHLNYGKVKAEEYVNNRLSGEGVKDEHIRYIEVVQEGGQTAVVTSYAAHPTSVSKKILSITRDYPGTMVDKLEASSDYDFAIFCAGMVGSHSPNYSIAENFELVDTMGNALADTLLNNNSHVILAQKSPLLIRKIPIALGDSQFRISDNLRLRPWVFDWLTGGLNAYISVLRLGNILMIGFPADFSGEIALSHQLEEEAHKNNLSLFVSCFNGAYIGYIIPDKYYDTVKKHETREMNWIGPYKGSFFAEVTKEIIYKSSVRSQ